MSSVSDPTNYWTPFWGPSRKPGARRHNARARFSTTSGRSSPRNQILILTNAPTTALVSPSHQTKRGTALANFRQAEHEEMALALLAHRRTAGPPSPLFGCAT